MPNWADWIKSHKAIISAFFGGAAYVAYNLGHPQIASGLTAFATFLFGGGILHSDAYHKENAPWNA